MKKGRKLLIAAIAAILASPLPALAAGKNEPLLAKAAAAGSVRVIVRLNVAGYQTEGKLASVQAVANQQTAIAQAQKTLLARFAGHNISGPKTFKTIPCMALQVDAAGLKALLDSPDVISVKEDVPVPPALNESIPLIKADQVDAKGFDGTGWTVAILDTGVRNTHEFLDAGKVVSEACYSTTYSYYNSSSLCPGGASSSIAPGSGANCSTAIDESCSHGTHVAGIAAGTGGSTASRGVAPGAAVIAIQVFSRFDHPLLCGGAAPCVIAYTSDIISGLERVYALRLIYNIAAVNLSLGGGQYDSYCDSEESETKEVIDNLRTAGIATAISSGNEAWNGYVGAPGCISSAVTVGATLDTADTLAEYSNHADMVDLLAPGSMITSSVADSDSSYATWRGTSMAAPHVAGAFAVMKSRNPAWSVDDIESLLKMTGVPVSRAGITKPRIDLLTAAGLADDDGYEENDTLAAAYDLSGSRGKWLFSVAGYGIQKDDDWYRIYAPPGRKQVRAELRFVHAGGNIDLCLYDAAGTPLQCSKGTGDSETVSYDGDAAGGTYYLKVYSSNAGNAYNLRWSTPVATAWLKVLL